jgi:pyruvate,orthophosphate dikinase
VKLEIMVPLVAFRGVFAILRDVIVRAAEAVEKETKQKLDYLIGTMIELPRAALRAGEIAEGDTGAAFFSFGTNDLTQTVLGLSRDDAGPILEAYAEQKLFTVDPFVSIDVEGVGELVRIGVERGRTAKPGLKVGICGEHGGDPKSIAFFDEVGLDYVSCSPYRVPIARMAAAQAAIRARTGSKQRID